MDPRLRRLLSGLRELAAFVFGFLWLCWPVIVLGLSIWIAVRHLR